MIDRVLVVDDHEPWRRYVCSFLQKNPRYEVAGESTDGLDAVRRARALQPDLILLDVGLPGLNGIEVARRLASSTPQSKILFLSEHHSWDIAEAALGTGARGYVLKSDAGRELHSGMEAVSDGHRFVSAKFGGRTLEKTDRGWAPLAAPDHEAAFYSDEASLLDGYAHFAEEHLRAGNAVVLVSTDVRLKKLHQRLQTRGIDVGSAARAGRFISMDTREMISNLLVEGTVDEARFWTSAALMIMEAARASNGSRLRVGVCGECGSGLWNAGRADAALAIERVWNAVARTFDVDSFCAYFVEGPVEAHLLDAICAEHSAVHSMAAS